MGGKRSSRRTQERWKGRPLEPNIDKAEFAVLARRSGVPLSDEEIALLYEGYGWFERFVADLDRPADARAEPALIFAPEIGS